MDSFIENYCGEWESEFGNRLVIKLVGDLQVKAAFYRSREHSPMLRPWFNNKPAENMVGILDSESQSTLDILLAGSTDGFRLNLSFDLDEGCYKSVVSSIIRDEEDEYFEEFYHLLGPLGHHKKC